MGMILEAVRPTPLRAAMLAIMRLPRPLLSRLAGSRRKARQGGMRLDEQLELALALHDRFGPLPLHQTDPVTARMILERGFAAFDARPRAMARVQDLVADQNGSRSDSRARVPVRVYTPRRARSGGPAIIYYHGGGGVVGSIQACDPVCRLLADDTRCVVISVGYRLAPEHRFPAAVEDAVLAHDWVRRSAADLDVDAARIAVGGESMGGNLAAVVCQQARDQGAPSPALQVLLYPALDFSASSPSHQTFAQGYLLDRALIDWFRDHYFADPAQRLDLRASPLWAVDLAGLPPALIVTAGFDPLRDEGCLYADRLQRAGVPVTYRCHDSLIHGFVSMTGAIDEARRAIARVTADIREALRP